MIRLTLLFCLLATVGEAQFTPVFNIPANYSGFDTKAFEMNDSGNMMIITRPYDGGPTTNIMVYNSHDFGQTWDSTLFLNQSMIKDNAAVTDGGMLYFTSLITVYSTTVPNYIRRVSHSSLDGGMTWTEKTIDSINGSLKERSLSFLNDSTGMFFYQHGVYLTNDYGQNWQHVDSTYPNSIGVFENRFVYYGNLDVHTYEPLTGAKTTESYDPMCQGFTTQQEYKNGTSYRSLFAWDGTTLGPQYNHNFASLNIDPLPLDNQRVIHFPQRASLIDLSISNSCINMVLDGKYVRSCDNAQTFYDVDAFNGNLNENVRFIEFINDTLGYLVSENLITYEWHLWETTNGGGINGGQLLTNSFTAGLNENTTDLSFELFPNPTSENINVISKEVIELIQIFSLDGKLLISKPMHSKEANFNIRFLLSGSYIVKAISKNSMGTHRFMKQ
jgi:hypothetical protein